MSDDFLNGLAKDFTAFEGRARDAFGGLSEDQLNWNPQPGSWSVGKCLDHLVTSNTPYFEICSSVAKGTKRTTLWERLPLLPQIFGAAVLNTVHPDTVRKSKAPRIFHPRTERVPLGILDTFCEQQRKLVEAIGSLRGVDLDKTIVTSPVASFIPYSLRRGLEIIAAHEERHLRQAERVVSEIASSQPRSSQ